MEQKKWTVNVAGLSPATTEDSLREFFSRVGDVTACVMDVCEDESEKRSARVSFANAEDMAEAFNMSGTSFEGSTITITKNATAQAGDAAHDAGSGAVGDRINMEGEQPSGDPHSGFDEDRDERRGLGSRVGRGKPVTAENGVVVEENKIIIRGLSADVSEHRLRALFEADGCIRDFFYNSKRHFAFIGFDSVEAMERALKRNGTELDGRALVVEQKRFFPQEGRQTTSSHPVEHTIVMRDLPPGVTVEGLREHILRELNDITIANVHLTHRGDVAFIDFTCTEDSERALSLNGTVLDGHTVSAVAKERRTCYKCNREGHTANNCRFSPQPCNICGRLGHMARDCRQRDHGDFMGRPGPGPRWHADGRGRGRDGERYYSDRDGGMRFDDRDGNRYQWRGGDRFRGRDGDRFASYDRNRYQDRDAPRSFPVGGERLPEREEDDDRRRERRGRSRSPPRRPARSRSTSVDVPRRRRASRSRSRSRSPKRSRRDHGSRRSASRSRSQSPSKSGRARRSSSEDRSRRERRGYTEKKHR